MKVDYEKVEKINEGLDYCNKRREKINEQIEKLPLSFGDELIEISNKRALEGYDQELKQIDKQYQYLLKERDKCFEDTSKEKTKMENTKAKTTYLTKKDLTDIPHQTDTIIILNRTFGKTLAQKIVTEMISYKNIEEDIICPIVTVFKALTDGIYVKDAETHKIELFRELRLGRVIGGQWRFIVLREGKGNNFPVYLGTQGRVWALTKEELE